METMTELEGGNFFNFSKNSKFREYGYVRELSHSQESKAEHPERNYPHKIRPFSKINDQ